MICRKSVLLVPPCFLTYYRIFYHTSLLCQFFQFERPYPFPKQQILDSFKLKQFADDNFKFDIYGLKFSKRVENTVGKGEIAQYKQFLLFPQCFQKTCTAYMYKAGLVWKRVTFCHLRKGLLMAADAPLKKWSNFLAITCANYKTKKNLCNVSVRK